MDMTNNNEKRSREEPSTAPEHGKWYNLTLGSSFIDHHQGSKKFCTLRYEFKPASIDKSQPGSLHKNKNNRVAVEFHNNQHGKQKVAFEGVSEDYKDNDAVLFFDGQNFRLERLHRAVKCLKHVRLPGEAATTAASAVTTPVRPTTQDCSPSLGIGANILLDKDVFHETQARVERIDKGDSENLGENSRNEIDVNSLGSPIHENYEQDENIDIVNDYDDDNFRAAKKQDTTEKEYNTGIDINIPHQIDTDDEIADVDINDDEAEKGPNAAEALRAQVNAESRQQQQTSTSSSSSESDTSTSRSGSGTGSGSSSSDSQSSDGDSINSI